MVDFVVIITRFSYRLQTETVQQIQKTTDAVSDASVVF